MAHPALAQGLNGHLSFRAAQTLGHQSEGTTSDGRKADQIDDSQNVIHSRTRFSTTLV